MHHIALPGSIPPKKAAALARRSVKVMALTTVSDKKAYIKKNNTWKLMKSWLASFSGGKCWYCEAISERAAGDVDHFRPKAGVTCNRVKLPAHDGYYWLAYDWLNYRYSCQRCNRPENDERKVLRGKANEFLLVDENERNMTPSCGKVERPALLDPCKLQDTKLLAHLVNGTVEAAYPQGTDESDRAIYTRNILGLNNFTVSKIKREGWSPINILIEHVGDIPAVKDELIKRLDPSAEYSSFYRAAISSHRDKDWVDALL